MPLHTVQLVCPVHDSFRVQQVAGMFDLPLAQRMQETFKVELPGVDEPWQIGLIVGPSGSGKSSVARQVFGDVLYRPGEWPRDRAVIDGLVEGSAELSAREGIGLLTAVGLGSPPSWVKPYHVLSGGEQMRCDLARALAPDGGAGVVCFDEFTSVVDRTVAQVCSAAVSRGIRSERIVKRFVAATCHYDVAPWLEPDWVLDMADRTLTRRRLRRPSIELTIHRSTRAAWPRFARHHYLSANLNPAARCYLAVWGDEPVAFCATLPVIGSRGLRRFTRIVTLPDYQGIGVGGKMLAAVAELHLEEGLRIGVTTSHPGLVSHCRASPRWRATGFKKTGHTGKSKALPKYRNSAGRAVASFEYLGGDPPRSTCAC